MGCSIKAIYDDEERYEEHCKKLGVKPKFTNDGFLDCYGVHANLIRRKINGEDVDVSDEAVLRITKERNRERLRNQIKQKEEELSTLRKQLDEIL